MKPLFRILGLALTGSLMAQTYSVVDLGTLGEGASFATGLNDAGHVSGYLVRTNGVTVAWLRTPDGTLRDLGSFGGTESRATAVNSLGQVTGYSLDADGIAVGFRSDGTNGLQRLSSPPGVGRTVPQAINRPGQIAGFTQLGDTTTAFRASPGGDWVTYLPLSDANVPGVTTAYGLNDAGRVVGSASGVNGFQRAYISDPSGSGWQDLGTLGGDESAAFAINNDGAIVGSAGLITGDTHAFWRPVDSAMTDLGTLGGIGSTASALNRQQQVVGVAEATDGAEHAFIWNPTTGMRDLNAQVPANSDWVLTEARGINEKGQIIGNGRHAGQSRAFLLTPIVGPDTHAPMAVASGSIVTNVNPYPYQFSVVFWDDFGVRASSIGTNLLRVLGPNGYDQPATLVSLSATNDLISLRAVYSIPAPNGEWNGTNNGRYAMILAGDVLRDTSGNAAAAGEVGSFQVATEAVPVVSLTRFVITTASIPADFVINARSSLPADPADPFHFVIDWEGDGANRQVFDGTNGITVSHTYTGIGARLVRLVATDVHGVTSPVYELPLNVQNATPTNVWQSVTGLPVGRRQAVGINANGTLVVLGGLPVKSNGGQVHSLAPGAAGWVENRRLSTAPTGFGAGLDNLGRIVVYGGIEPNATAPNRSGFVYSLASGPGAPIASKNFAVHSFAFVADDAKRLYSFGGSLGAGTTGAGSTGVERYDAKANTWTVLAPLPEPRVEALAVADGLGHLLVIGGLDPATGTPASSVFRYDIASDTWSRRSDLPGNIANWNGRVAVGGSNGLIYFVGGEVRGSGGAATSATDVYDSVQEVWWAGPPLISARGFPAATVGNDGYFYVMGGENNLNGGNNNGMTTVERLDITTSTTPQIVTFPFDLGRVGVPYAYRLIATGSPRPTFGLLAGPTNMTLNPTTGWLTWTPTPEQVGSQRVQVGASSPLGATDLRFEILVQPADVTPPTAPTNFFLFARNSHSVTFSWSPATDEVGVHHYQLWRLFRGSRSSHWGVAVDHIPNRSIVYPIFGGATFAVAAVDAAGNVSARSAVLGASSVPFPLIQHATTGESTNIILGSSFFYTLSGTAAPAFGYTGFSGPPGMVFTPTRGPDTNAQYLVVQWMPTADQLGTNHFTVTATNLDAVTTLQLGVVVLPPTTDTVAPTPVGAITASAITADSMQLNWTPAGDNLGIAKYALQAVHIGAVGQSNHVVAVTVPGALTQTMLTGLLPGAGYTVVIVAFDAAGNRSLPTQIFVTTQRTLGVPVRAQLGVVPGTLDLAWPAADPAALYTLESSPALGDGGWTPVESAQPWPSASTNATVTLDAGAVLKLFRVRASY